MLQRWRGTKGWGKASHLHEHDHDWQLKISLDPDSDMTWIAVLHFQSLPQEQTHTSRIPMGMLNCFVTQALLWGSVAVVDLSKYYGSCIYSAGAQIPFPSLFFVTFLTISAVFCLWLRFSLNAQAIQKRLSEENVSLQRNSVLTIEKATPGNRVALFQYTDKCFVTPG